MKQYLIVRREEIELLSAKLARADAFQIELNDFVSDYTGPDEEVGFITTISGSFYANYPGLTAIIDGASIRREKRKASK